MSGDSAFRAERRDGPALQQHQRSAANAPFHVLRRSEEGFQPQAEAPQSVQFSVGQHAAALVIRNKHVHEGGIIARDHVVIRSDFARYDRFPQPRCAFDDHAVAPVANRIDRKHHAALVGLHHFLHDNRHTRVGQHRFLRAVEQRARREERCPALLNPAEDGVATANVQIALLLAGKACRMSVFCNRARTHRHEIAVGELRVRCQNRLTERSRQGGGHYQIADCVCCLLHRSQILNVEVLREASDERRCRHRTRGIRETHRRPQRTLAAPEVPHSPCGRGSHLCRPRSQTRRTANRRSR